jgi:hypothetical protein
MTKVKRMTKAEGDRLAGALGPRLKRELDEWLASCGQSHHLMLLTDEEVEMLTMYLREDIASGIEFGDEIAEERMPVLQNIWLKLTGKPYQKAA